LVEGTVNAAIVIPPDFDRQLERAAAGGDPPTIQALYDGAEAVLAGNAEGFLRSLTAASGAAPAHGGGVQVTVRALFNPTLDGRPFMVSGTFGFVLSFLTTLITAVSIVNERLTGTFDQLQVTPATSIEILLGKLLPLGAVFALDVALMVLVAGVVLQVWPAGSVVLFLVISAIYVLVSLALGLVISATSATTAEAVQKTVLTSIPLIQLSGFVFPTRNMPRLLGWATELLPATHYIRVSRAIYLRGEGLLTQVPDVACIILFGVVLMAYALRTLGART
jgi:ABC-2 type transport system permease protein